MSLIGADDPATGEIPNLRSTKIHCSVLLIGTTMQEQQPQTCGQRDGLVADMQLYSLQMCLTLALGRGRLQQRLYKHFSCLRKRSKLPGTDGEHSNIILCTLYPALAGSHLHSLIITACYCQPPIWTDLRCSHPIAVTTKCEQKSLGGQRPQLHSTTAREGWLLMLAQGFKYCAITVCRHCSNPQVCQCLQPSVQWRG